jgi:hypothetical protein
MADCIQRKNSVCVIFSQNQVNFSVKCTERQRLYKENRGEINILNVINNSIRFIFLEKDSKLDFNIYAISANLPEVCRYLFTWDGAFSLSDTNV